MTKKRGCPHCSTVGRERDFGWTCHSRQVRKTPTRDDAAYWRHGPLPDHSTVGLYAEGPDSDGSSAFDLMTDAVAQEAMELDEGYGQRLHAQQERASRYHLISFLAMAPHLWPYIRLKMKIAETPKEQRREIQLWLQEAREMRNRLIEASKREALRIAKAA